MGANASKMSVLRYSPVDQGYILKIVTDKT